MKKSLALITLLIAALVVTPCFAGQEKKSAYDLYSEANELVSTVDSVLVKTDVKMGMELDIEGEKMSLDVLVDGMVKVVMKSETDMDMMMEMAVSMMGMDVEITGFYTDGMMYMDTMGEKSKMPMPIDEALKQANMININFDEESIKEQSFEEVEDGTEISFVLDAKFMTDEMMSQLGALNGLLGAEMDMSISDIKVTALIDKDNNLKSINMEFDADADVEGQKMSMSFEVAVVIEEIGGQEIEFPENLDDYELIEQ